MEESMLTLLGGQNAGLESHLLPDTQYAFGENVSNRGGSISVRPSFRYLYTIGPTYSDMDVYNLEGNVSHVIVKGADITIHNVDTGAEVNHTGLLSASATRWDFLQAEKYFVVQDGSLSEPVIIDETSRVDISSQDEKTRMPKGYCMVYGHGRIFVVVDHIWTKAGAKIENLGRRNIRAGNIMATNGTGTIPEIFVFTEDGYLNEGGAINLPNEQGFVNAMRFLRNASTGQGVGSLVVASRDGMSAFSVSSPRDTWKDIDFAQTLFCDPNCGAYDGASFITVNDDIAYRAMDGIRFLRYTATQKASSGGALSDTPLSIEVDPILSQDSYEDIKACSMSYAGNRLLVTSGGRDEDGFFRCLVSLDFAPAYNMNSPASPAWDGIYTGFKFVKVFMSRLNGIPTHMAVVFINDRYEVWALGTTTGIDTATYPEGDDTEDISTPIKSRFFTRGMMFNKNQDVPSLIDKQFRHIQMWIHGLSGTVSAMAYYRRHGYELWSKCEGVSVKAIGANKQSRYRLHLPAESIVADVGDNGLDTNIGMIFEFCIEMTGGYKITTCIFTAEAKVGDTRRNLSEENAVELVETEGAIAINHYDYEVGNA